MHAPLLGIFGGTFDPVHLGHIGALEQVCQSISFAQLRWVVSAKPPHKDSVRASVDDRIAMLNLALTDYENWFVDDSEAQRSTPSYTFDTLIQLQQDYPDHRLVMIIGGDSLANLPTWYRYPELIDLAHWVVMHRPNYNVVVPTDLQARVVESSAQLTSSAHPSLWLHRSSKFNISSSELRTALSTESASTELQQKLPSAVFNYIKAQQLYKI